MSDIKDFGCMVNDCPEDAAELIKTDAEWGREELVVLCIPHHAQESYGVSMSGLEIGRRLLICDTSGSWFFIPEDE